MSAYLTNYRVRGGIIAVARARGKLTCALFSHAKKRKSRRRQAGAGKAQGLYKESRKVFMAPQGRGNLWDSVTRRAERANERVSRIKRLIRDTRRMGRRAFARRQIAGRYYRLVYPPSTGRIRPLT